jgi:nucleotide-binding universal stress UspA family protein
MAQKILWAVDALDDSSEIFTNVVRLLQSLEQPLGASIQPIYILSPEQMNFSLDSDLPDMERYIPAAKKAVETRVKESKLKNVLDPKVLVNNRPSLRESVALLCGFAAKGGFDCIVAGSHGKKGFDRLVMGSFAEELVLQSKVPVIVTGSGNSRVSPAISRILFPTDFEDKAFETFQQVVRLAASLKAELSVLHVSPRVLEPAFQNGVYLLSGGWVPTPEFIESRTKKQKEASSKWEETAKELGVKCRTVFDSKASSVVQALIENADKEKADLICMAAHSGRVASALVGSVTRQTVRNSHVPVWVLRPEASK